MMLGLCKMKGWNLADYYKPEHPLQIAIKRKIYELCEIKQEYPMTTDGCGVPIVSMPLKNLLKGYLNLFCSDRYKKICDAFLNCPYIIGGEDRTDTKIMQNSAQSKLVAKVGAGGLCVVLNVNEKSAFVVKITDCDMKSRELIVLDMVNKLGWSDVETDKSIKTLDGKIVGYYDLN